MKRRAIRGFIFGLVLSAVAAGCGGGGGGGGTTVNGTVAGVSLTPRGTANVAGVATCPTTGGSYSAAYLFVEIADFAAVCATGQANANKASSTTLILFVVRAGAQAQSPIATAVYQINTNPSPDPSGNILLVQAMFDKLSSTCTSNLPAGAGQATSGSITFTSISSSSAAGSFDLNFPNGAPLSGSFSSTVCSAPAITPCPSSTTMSCQA